MRKKPDGTFLRPLGWRSDAKCNKALNQLDACSPGGCFREQGFRLGWGQVTSRPLEGLAEGSFGL